MRQKKKYLRLTRVPYLSTRLVAVCQRVWREFFQRLSQYDGEPTNKCRSAIWIFHFSSASFRVRPQLSWDDPDDVDWEPMFTISVGIDGLTEVANAILFDETKQSNSKLKRLELEFVTWLANAVLESWKSAEVRSAFNKCRRAHRTFTIAYAMNDDIFDDEDLTFLVGRKRKPRGVPD